ncbi:MAG TPA: urea transporter [Ignavibacteriaceae bacterium]|nr:urea transporter [Ignavibacteriaceae bacterium]
MNYFLDSILFSYSQIFFCNRKWFGLVALLATFIVPEMGGLALLGVIISNSLAIYLKFDRTKIRNGFYGFNGILFGAASSFYFEITPYLVFIIIIFLVITFFLSAVLENYLAVGFNLPGFSLPFILTLYIFIVFLTNYDFINVKSLHYLDYDFLNFIPAIAKKYFQSMALILFQPSLISGIILTIAILFFSRVMFIISIFAFVLNYYFLQLIIPTQVDSLIVLAGFNSILAGFALGGNLVIISKKSLPLVIVSTLMVIIITGFFTKLLANYSLPVLVLPFNFIVLSILYSLKFRKEQSDMALLYFQPGSPEENFYYHQNWRSRFQRFKLLFPELPFFGEFFVSQGFEGEHTHKEDWKYAWDFVVTDEENKYYKDEGNSLSEHYCFKIPVIAPLKGKVVKVVDGIPNNPIGDINIEQNWGNTIILDHGEGLFSSISHFDPDSIKVEEGEEIKKGKVLGLCGNSGRSPFPHIHFQFQATDKLGDKTIKFPIAYYLQKNIDSIELRTFDFPDEGTHVQNIETHSIIKKAFNFRLGDKYKFNYEEKSKQVTEEWEVKIDLFNSLFIENSFGETANIYLADKIFYLTNYVGKKRSALYHFYLLSVKVPLCFSSNLKWEDDFQVSKLLSNFTRYLSEFLLLIKQQIKASVKYEYKEIVEGDNKSEFIIISLISIKGSGIFSYFNKNMNGSLVIGEEGVIKKLELNNNGKIFLAKSIQPEDKKV